MELALVVVVGSSVVEVEFDEDASPFVAAAALSAKKKRWEMSASFYFRKNWGPKYANKVVRA